MRVNAVCRRVRYGSALRAKVLRVVLRFCAKCGETPRAPNVGAGAICDLNAMQSVLNPCPCRVTARAYTREQKELREVEKQDKPLQTALNKAKEEVERCAQSKDALLREQSERETKHDTLKQAVSGGARTQTLRLCVAHTVHHGTL
jgi:hypothetical protein